MTWNPEGSALQVHVAELLAKLPPQAGRAVRIQRCAATIVSRFQQADRQVLQTHELDSIESALAELNHQLITLQDSIDKMPEEARWMLNCTMRNLNDEDKEASVNFDEDGREPQTRLAGSTAEISAMIAATSAWAAAAGAGKGPGGRPKEVAAAAVADSALQVFEKLTGIKVGKNPEGKKEDGAAADFLEKLYVLFGIDLNKVSASSQLKAAVRRREDLLFGHLQKPRGRRGGF